MFRRPQFLSHKPRMAKRRPGLAQALLSTLRPSKPEVTPSGREISLLTRKRLLSPHGCARLPLLPLPWLAQTPLKSSSGTRLARLACSGNTFPMRSSTEKPAASLSKRSKTRRMSKTRWALSPKLPTTRPRRRAPLGNLTTTRLLPARALILPRSLTLAPRTGRPALRPLVPQEATPSTRDPPKPTTRVSGTLRIPWTLAASLRPLQSVLSSPLRVLTAS